MVHFLSKSRILTNNFDLFRKIYLSVKGKRFEDVNLIQKACTAFLMDSSVENLKYLIDVLLDSAKHSTPSVID